jgi:hypothetical protein
MKHLDMLRVVNIINAYLVLVLCLLCAVGLGIAGVVMLAQGTSPDAWVFVGSSVISVLMGVGLGTLYRALARRVGEARWRPLQTVLAIAALGNNPPLGLAYGLYALWVCWVNPDTRMAFETSRAV